MFDAMIFKFNSDIYYVSVGKMEIYNLLSSVAVRIPQLVTVQLAESMKQNLFISETLNEMRNNSLLCDTCIVGNDGQSLHAHACILAAVSPILRSLLTQKSSTNIRISTDSIASDMWERVLSLIYCGDVQLPVCDLITFLDVTHELDIRGLHVVYEPVEPTRRSCNLRLVAQKDDDPSHETRKAAPRKDASFSVAASEGSESSEDKDLNIGEERLGFDIVGGGLKKDMHIDSSNRSGALQSFHGSDGTLIYLDDVTRLSDPSEDKHSDMLPPSASQSLVDSMAMDVKSEHGGDVHNKDTTAKFTPARSRNPSSPHRLLTCKTEPCDNQSLSRWCGADSAMSVSQESDVLAEAFVSSGLLPPADVFSRHQYISSEYGWHLFNLSCHLSCRLFKCVSSVLSVIFYQVNTTFFIRLGLVQ